MKIIRTVSLTLLLFVVHVSLIYSQKVEKELTYLQRAALNNGKAKDEHLKVMKEVENNDFNFDDFDALDFINNQL